MPSGPQDTRPIEVPVADGGSIRVEATPSGLLLWGGSRWRQSLTREEACQCMHAELDRGLLSAFCYAFSSMADFEHANVDAELGGMEHLCWRGRFSIAIAGNTDGAEDNNAYDVSGCPGP